jgi:ferredoxin
MSLKINDDCTSCDACVSVCPNTAITAGDVIYEINADRCTECVGAEDAPQCQLVCPADAIVAGAKESKDALMAKYKALHV